MENGSFWMMELISIFRTMYNWNTSLTFLLISLIGLSFKYQLADGVSFDTTAAMELILHTSDQVKMTKYVRGVYTNAGSVAHVEGNVQQVHPNVLCSDRPMLTYGYIYVIKLEPKPTRFVQDRFCQSAAEKANIAIRNGATAVILIITENEEALSELSQVIQPLERPVIIIRDGLDEDKLYTVLSYRETAYMRVTPIRSSPDLAREELIDDDFSNKDSITYIGIAVIFGLIVVLSLLAMAVIVKLRRVHRQIQFQARGRLVDSIGTHKYSKRISASISSSSTSPGDHTECCPICLERYRNGDDIKTLPCTHQYHKKCIDKWLMEHRTCPCCFGDIDELITRGLLLPEQLNTNKTKTQKQTSTAMIRHNIRGYFAPSCTTSLTLSNHKQVTAGVHRSKTDQKEHPDLLQQQYQYLLHRLHQLKRQRPSSISVSDIETNYSSCYSSTFNIDGSLPCENVFIGDSCQGGFPQQCSEYSLTDIELGSQLTRPYASSKSTLPSIGSDNISPRVSEWDLNLVDDLQTRKPLKHSHSEKCMKGEKCKYSSTHTRTVTFRYPESEVMSSADDDIETDTQDEEDPLNCLEEVKT